MRIGVVVPSFSHDATEAIAVSHIAEDVGLHGVFCYDHLWPMGEPGKPAISPFPLLGALAEATRTIRLGTLVARVGLVPSEVLVAEMVSLHLLSAGRLIASLGTGDHKSAAENRAYGAPFAHARDRRALVERAACELVDLGVTVWIGGGSDATNALAPKCGAMLNLWGVTPATIAAIASHTPVSWAGQFPKSAELAAERLASLERAGAEWAVYIWPGSVDPLLEAVERAGVVLE